MILVDQIWASWHEKDATLRGSVTLKRKDLKYEIRELHISYITSLGIDLKANGVIVKGCCKNWKRVKTLKVKPGKGSMEKSLWDQRKVSYQK